MRDGCESAKLQPLMERCQNCSPLLAKYDTAPNIVGTPKGKRDYNFDSHLKQMTGKSM